MSIEAMSIVLHHSKATGAAKILLLGVANHQSDSGAWPSVSTLSRYAGVSERRAQQLLRGLEESGELIVLPQQAPVNGKYKTNLYWVNVSCPTDCDGTAGHRVGVKSGAPRGEVLSTLGVKPTSPKPKENLKEHKNKGVRLSDDYRPSENLVAWAHETFPGVDVKKETYAFIDYFTSLPGQRGLKTNWDAAWRNWIRKASERVPRSRQPQAPKQTNLQRNLALVQKIMAEEGRLEIEQG